MSYSPPPSYYEPPEGICPTEELERVTNEDDAIQYTALQGLIDEYENACDEEIELGLCPTLEQAEEAKQELAELTQELIDRTGCEDAITAEDVSDYMD